MTRELMRLYATALTPRERDALALISAEPGITIEQLAARMGVTYGRTWQIVARLERGHVRRTGGRTLQS